jgi:hypothetical protein
MGAIVEQHKHPDYPRLTIQLRRRSRFYQSLTFLDGRKLQHSLKTDKLHTALKLGAEWYRTVLRSSITEAKQHPLDRLGTTPTVADVFKSFRLTLPPHRKAYVDEKWGALIDFWRTVIVTDVTPQMFRATTPLGAGARRT